MQDMLNNQHEDLIRTASEAAAKSVSQALKEYNKHTVNFATILGIVTGALFCCAGFVIICMGLTGSVEWVFEAGSVTTRLSNAGPGVALSLMGMIIIWRYRPRKHIEIRFEPMEIKVVTSHDIPEEDLKNLPKFSKTPSVISEIKGTGASVSMKTSPTGQR
ncbi:MAG: hypothetical protein FVQ80_09970 [Planctomycetes bacterium]|nr:hypothetical protein [Planctomycetota bacterium]